MAFRLASWSVPWSSGDSQVKPRSMFCVGLQKSNQYCFVFRVLTTVELELTRFGGVTFQMLITKLVYMLELTLVVLMVKLCLDRSLFKWSFYNKIMLLYVLPVANPLMLYKHLCSGNSKLARA